MAEREEIESWKRNPWKRLPTWAKWVVGMFSALLLLGIGAALGSGEEDELKSELAEAHAEVAEATAAQDDARATADAVLSRRDIIIRRAKVSAAKLVGGARSESAKLADTLEELKEEVDATRRELADVDSSLAGAEREAALSSMGDGIWKTEVDFIAGTYRAPGGDGCYWATLNSADPYDIASNENGTGPQIATIESAYFQTKGCGTWERISE